MKKLFSIVSAVCIGCAAFAGQPTSILMQGSTNLVAYNGTTWQVGTIAAASNPTTGIVTNYFNLTGGSVGNGTGWSYNTAASPTNAVINQATFNATGGFIFTGAQPNTNQLPNYAVNISPAYPGVSIYGPAKTLGIYVQVNLNVAATTPRTFQFNWFQTPDGTNIVGIIQSAISGTNAIAINTPTFTQFVTVPTGSTQGSCLSNFVAGPCQFTLLGQIVNTNQATGTNILVEATQQPEL